MGKNKNVFCNFPVTRVRPHAYETALAAEAIYTCYFDHQGAARYIACTTEMKIPI